MPGKEINKRKFIKYGLLGIGGITCGLYGCNLFANGDEDEKESPAPPPSMTPDDLWKWSKEALFYSETPRGVKCLICPNECLLKPDELSICRNRINVENKLYTIAYGNPCAVHIDPIEKKPLYHFLPTSSAFSIATAGCNLACLNCQNWSISQTSPKETRNYDLMPEKVVESCIDGDCDSIAYTYSEPVTFYEYTYDTAKIARENGIKNILVSAGYINEEPLRKLCKYIDGANIDLKSFSNDIYIKLNGGTLDPVLNTLKIFKEENVWLEITNLVVPTWTDDMDMIKKMCEWLVENGLHQYPLHFSRFHPMYKLTHLPATPATTLQKAKKIALAAGMEYVYIGNVPGSEGSNTYCPGCNTLLVERKGYSVTKINIEDNKCNSCGKEIPGIWQ